MKIFVFSMREYDELDFFKKFAKDYGIEFDYTTDYPTMENVNMVKGYDGVSIITTKTDKKIIDAWKERGVKAISTRSIGVDHIDVEYAHSVGMGVAHVEYSPNSVANYTIMLMLMACRKIEHILKRGDLQDYSLKGKIGKEISNCTVGIIGTGKIGKTVAKRLTGFDCKILAYDIYQNKEVEKYATYTDLDTIYRECDIISLHAPATDENFHMIDKNAISKMKNDVIIINCARGSLIDSNALMEGLDIKKIGFAALDVFENEMGLYYLNKMGEVLGNDELNRLKSYPNVILSPHTAFYTDEAVSNMVENSIKGLVGFEKEEKNIFEV